MSTSKATVAQIDERLKAIGNDEFKLAKRLYDETHKTFNIVTKGVGAVFFLVSIFWAIQTFTAEQRVKQLIDDSEKRIDRIVGQSEAGAAYSVKHNQENPIILYTFASFDEKSNQMKFSFLGTTEITGRGESYANVPRVNVIYETEKFLDAIEYKNEASRRYTSEDFSSTKTINIDSYINSRTSAGLRLSISHNAKSCAQYQNLLEKLLEPKITGSITFLPIILNANGTVEEQTVPFEIYPLQPHEFPACEIDESKKLSSTSNVTETILDDNN